MEEMPLSLKEKLARHKKDLAREHLSEPTVSQHAGDPEFTGKWRSMQAEPFSFDGQCAWVRTVSYPLDTPFGRYRFSDLKEAVARWNEEGWPHPLSANGLSFDDLLFFDTETTGLGHGVGNTIFLIGCARMHDDRIEVKQFFLPSPGDEVALYQAFLTDVKDLKNLVTYNGKAFDWPQIKTRHTFLRDAVPKLPKFGHFDLLHASRRLWKDTLESSRLSVVERDILGVKRGRDTPGHLVPIYYFEYIRKQNPEIMRGVLEHNEYDILSLVMLYTHLSRLILDQEPCSVKEQYEIGRWHLYLGLYDQAFACLSRIVEEKSREGTFAKKYIAEIYKRQKRYDESMSIWKELVRMPAFRSDTLIDMAKVCEHHYKDYEKALYYAKQAYQTEKQKMRLLNRSENVRDIIKRIHRLERKLTMM
jgi:hypothetical protein